MNMDEIWTENHKMDFHLTVSDFISSILTTGDISDESLYSLAELSGVGRQTTVARHPIVKPTLAVVCAQFVHGRRRRQRTFSAGSRAERIEPRSESFIHVRIVTVAEWVGEQRLRFRYEPCVCETAMVLMFFIEREKNDLLENVKRMKKNKNLSSSTEIILIGQLSWKLQSS